MMENEIFVEMFCVQEKEKENVEKTLVAKSEVLYCHLSGVSEKKKT